jgi:hypothetical protein
MFHASSQAPCRSQIEADISGLLSFAKHKIFDPLCKCLIDLSSQINFVTRNCRFS